MPKGRITSERERKEKKQEAFSRLCFFEPRYYCHRLHLCFRIKPDSRHLFLSISLDCVAGSILVSPLLRTTFVTRSGYFVFIRPPQHDPRPAVPLSTRDTQILGQQCSNLYFSGGRNWCLAVRPSCHHVRRRGYHLARKQHKSTTSQTLALLWSCVRYMNG